jgi:hypothetical protein
LSKIELKFGGDQKILTTEPRPAMRGSNFQDREVMFADDTTGEGHISRVIGNEPFIFMTVALAE